MCGVDGMIMQIAVDWAWWKKDPGQPALLQRYQNFFSDQGKHQGTLCSGWSVYHIIAPQ